MPYIRQSRDKRGFEQTLVLHQNRHGQGAPRVLYLFRGPANLKVGRVALDSEVREALEHTHPDITFDWNALTRDAVVTRQDPAQPRPGKGQRKQGGAARRDAERAAEPAEPSDLSPLAEVLGAAEAARLRQRHRDLVHRIGRRARTPEDRVRLLELAEALRPDLWPDAATIRARASEMDAECDAIARELPPRRRGRRGGRDRNAPGADTPSGIMTGETEDNDQSHQYRVDRSADADDSGGDDRVGAEPDQSAEPPAETPGFPVDR